MSVRAWAGCAAAILWVVTTAAPAIAQSSSELPPKASTTPFPVDPAVRQGRLPNGMRYALMSNDRPVGGMSIRLRFDVGSYEEAEAHRGVAHFLEHMAFNGTRRIPEGQIARRFAAAGVTFGRDQNANTSLFATTYQLTLGRTDRSSLDLAFSWLRDIGDGMLLTPEAVDRERGVILAEHDARLSAQQTWRDAYQAFVAPSARSRVRSPIGTRETIREIDAATLRDFHQSWYRPENAVLTVVGDFSLDQLEDRVRRTFSSWRASGSQPVRVTPTPFDLTRPIDVLTYADARLNAGIGICRPAPWTLRGPDSFDRRRTYVARGLMTAIVNRRLQVMSQGAAAPFAGATIAFTPWPREAELLCLNVAPPAGGDWRNAMEVALTEVRRFAAHGPQAAEIARLVNTQKQMNALAAQQSQDRYSHVLAQSLLEIFPLHGLDGGGVVAPGGVVALYDSVVESLSPDDIRMALGDAWGRSDPLISVLMPTPPSADDVREAWAQAAGLAEPDAGAAAAQSEVWGYADFGPPGEVISRETIPDYGFTRLRFANGLVLNVKSVAFTRNLVEMIVELDGGRNRIADADFQTASIGAGVVNSGGLGRHSQREIQDLFPDRRIGIALGMKSDVMELRGITRPADLQTQLQWTAAFLSDPGFRDDFPTQRRQAIDATYRAWRSQPMLALKVAIAEAVAPGNPRSLPPREEIEALTMADFERIYRPILTEAPLELTLVGDMSEGEMIALAAATLGALPGRGATSPTARKAFSLMFGENRPRVEAFHEGARDQAAFSATWPLFVSDPDRRREQRALELLRLVLQTRIRDEVREVLGATYSPSVNLVFDDDGDQAALSVDIITSPVDVERVSAAVRRVVASLAEGRLTQAELNAVRTPALAGVRDSRATTGWWARVLSGSAREPETLHDAFSWVTDYRDMRLVEVKDAARKWLSGPPIEGVALPVEDPATSADRAATQ